MLRRSLLAMLSVASVTITAVLASCTGGGAAEPEQLLDFPDTTPGAVVGLIAVENGDTRTIEWVDRLEGTIRRLDIDDDDATASTVANIEIGIDGEQRGLLGQVIIGGRRFAAWTRPVDLVGDFELVVGEVIEGASGDIVWSGGRAGSGAIGGVLGELDGQILLGLGRNTGWDTDTGVGGAFLSIDPDGPADQEGIALSVGYTNPWAFTVTASGQVWFADNAAGPDPDDPDVDDIERIGRADLIEDRNDVARIGELGRAPTAMIELPDGRLGICGFLDNELRAYSITDDGLSLERAGTIMPCLTSAAIFDDGTIVTAAQSNDGETLQILRP